MGIDKVRKDILSGAEEKLQEVGEKMKLGNEIDLFFKMAEGFRSRKNYSVAYSMYFRCLRKQALLFITEKVGEKSGFTEKGALSAVVEKKLFPLNKSEYEVMLKKYNQVMGRTKLEKEDVEHIRNIVLKLRSK
jgi:hypothetical protein